MSVDSEVAVLGTGVAPLVAASHLLAQGKSVLLLNPDHDFFLEDSELPMDPLLYGIHPRRLRESLPERALEVLRPDFPGAIEYWSGQLEANGSGYRDPAAPYVRSRSRIWMSSPDKTRTWDWEYLEDFYVEASDADLKPQILDGVQATSRFPGIASTGSTSSTSEYRGLLVPKLCDVDVTRYRNGLLEFVRERLGPDRTIADIAQLEVMPGGIRFYSGGAARTARLAQGMLVFWTPRLTNWVLAQAKKLQITPVMPKGLRLWEQWSLMSRDVLDPGIVGLFPDLAVWADVEGMPSSQQPSTRLEVLRSGGLGSWESLSLPQGGSTWASAEAFQDLAFLCNGFLKWDRFSVRAMRPRAIFEWADPSVWLLSDADPNVRVINGCDGPLVDVVRAARKACTLLEETS